MRIAYASAILFATTLSASAHGTTHAHAPQPAVMAPASSAGEPGRVQDVTRTIEVSMYETDTEMLFEPRDLRVGAGETVRLLVRNDGAIAHEFVIDTAEGNASHKAEMMEMLEAGHTMHHADANEVTLQPGQVGELIWTFTADGWFEFACLLPGHQELGMSGSIEVRPARHPSH